MRGTGASFAHWSNKALRLEDVERFHQAGLLVCTYTVDTELQWYGAAAMGIDMITTNEPARLVARLATGRLVRSAAGR